MGTERKSYENTAIRVCLDSHEDNDIQGSLHSPFCEEKIAFANVAQLLVGLEAITDDRGFPEPMFRRRSFMKKKKLQRKTVEVCRNLEEIEKEFGQIETLRLYVTGRKFAGIQGHVLTMSNGSVQKYASELALIKILENIVTEDRDKKLSVSV